jgi:hypothetical protein
MISAAHEGLDKQALVELNLDLTYTIWNNAKKERVAEAGTWSLEYNLLRLNPVTGDKGHVYYVNDLSPQSCKLSFMNDRNLQTIELAGTRQFDFNAAYNKAYAGTWRVDSMAYTGERKNRNEKEAFEHQWFAPGMGRALESTVWLNSDGTWKIVHKEGMEFSGTWKTSKDLSRIFLDDDASIQDYIVQVRKKGNQVFVTIPDIQFEPHLMNEVVMTKMK